MQTIASTKKGVLVSADQAVKKENYYCLECKKIVRLRGGRWRSLHFYHFAPSPACRLHERSVLHRKIQNFIQNHLSPEEIVLEQPFPSIGRIADIVWRSQRIIFEIQCSAITAQEVKQRIADYRTAGYRVVWILHDKRFNRYLLSEAELFLQTHPHYFVSTSLFFYDQFSLIKGDRRVYKSAPQPIDLKEPYRDKQVPAQLKNREPWKLGFVGDLLDLAHLGRLPLLPRLRKERRTLPNLFHLLFRSCLEKKCS